MAEEGGSQMAGADAAIQDEAPFRQNMAGWVAKPKDERLQSHFYFMLEGTHPVEAVTSEFSIQSITPGSPDHAVVDQLSSVTADLEVELFLVLLERGPTADDSAEDGTEGGAAPKPEFIVRRLVDMDGQPYVSDYPIDGSQFYQDIGPKLGLDPGRAEAAVLLVTRDSLAQFFLDLFQFSRQSTLAASRCCPDIRQVLKRFADRCVASEAHMARLIPVLRELVVGILNLESGLDHAVLTDHDFLPVQTAFSRAMEWEALEQVITQTGGRLGVAHPSAVGTLVRDGLVKLEDVAKWMMACVVHAKSIRAKCARLAEFLKGLEGPDGTSKDNHRQWVMQTFDKQVLQGTQGGRLSFEDGDEVLTLVLRLFELDEATVNYSLLALADRYPSQSSFMIGLLVRLNKALKSSTSSCPSSKKLFLDLTERTIKHLDISRFCTSSAIPLRAFMDHEPRVPAKQNHEDRLICITSADPTPMLAIDHEQLAEFIAALLQQKVASSRMMELAFGIIAKAASIRRGDFVTLWLPFLHKLIAVLEQHKIPLSKPRWSHIFAAILDAFVCSSKPRIEVMEWKTDLSRLACFCVHCYNFRTFFAADQVELRGEGISQFDVDHIKTYVLNMMTQRTSCAYDPGTKLLVISKVGSYTEKTYREWAQAAEYVKSRIRRFDEAKLKQILGIDFASIWNTESLGLPEAPLKLPPPPPPPPPPAQPIPQPFPVQAALPSVLPPSQTVPLPTPVQGCNTQPHRLPGLPPPPAHPISQTPQPFPIQGALPPVLPPSQTVPLPTPVVRGYNTEPRLLPGLHTFWADVPKTVTGGQPPLNPNPVLAFHAHSLPRPSQPKSFTHPSHTLLNERSTVPVPPLLTGPATRTAVPAPVQRPPIGHGTLPKPTESHSLPDQRPAGPTPPQSAAPSATRAVPTPTQHLPVISQKDTVWPGASIRDMLDKAVQDMPPVLDALDTFIEEELPDMREAKPGLSNTELRIRCLRTCSKMPKDLREMCQNRAREEWVKKAPAAWVVVGNSVLDKYYSQQAGSEQSSAANPGRSRIGSRFRSMKPPPPTRLDMKSLLGKYWEEMVRAKKTGGLCSTRRIVPNTTSTNRDRERQAIVERVVQTIVPKPAASSSLRSLTQGGQPRTTASSPTARTLGAQPLSSRTPPSRRSAPQVLIVLDDSDDAKPSRPAQAADTSTTGPSNTARLPQPPSTSLTQTPPVQPKQEKAETAASSLKASAPPPSGSAEAFANYEAKMRPRLEKKFASHGPDSIMRSIRNTWEKMSDSDRESYARAVVKATSPKKEPAGPSTGASSPRRKPIAPPTTASSPRRKFVAPPRMASSPSNSPLEVVSGNIQRGRATSGASRLGASDLSGGSSSSGTKRKFSGPERNQETRKKNSLSSWKDNGIDQATMAGNLYYPPVGPASSGAGSASRTPGGSGARSSSGTSRSAPVPMFIDLTLDD